MKEIADLTDFNTFKQAVGQYASDRLALKALKSLLMDKKVEIELKLDSPFVAGFAVSEQKLVSARDWTIRKMNYVDGFLTKTKPSENVGWLMWVVYRDVPGRWLRTTEHPNQWLAKCLTEEDEPNDLRPPISIPINQEQWDQLSNIELA